VTRGGRGPRSSSVPFSRDELLGMAQSHVTNCPDSDFLVHKGVLGSFLALRRAAATAGIDLWPVSAFRDFGTQVRIWNEKWTGRRALLSRDGHRLDPAALSPGQRVEAILAWSAAPGASRHHWGTDLDVYDRAAVPSGYRPQLLVEEYADDGPFAGLNRWLEVHMVEHGFYRPYRRDLGGVQPEPWHLSHFRTAREASRRLRLPTLRAAIRVAPIEGRDALLERLPVVYSRYVRAVEAPPGPRGSPHLARRRT
jgi:LAS superfamily LD-carboxypeptidase LdcB